MDEMTEQEARGLLKASIPWKGAGKAAEAMGISRGHLSEIMSGKKAINDKALAFIGCERVIIRRQQKDACHDVGNVANN